MILRGWDGKKIEFNVKVFYERDVVLKVGRV